MTKQIKHITYRNGVTLVYFVAFLNAVQQLIIAYGVKETPAEQVAWTMLLNFGIAIIARALNLPYRPSPSSIATDTAVSGAEAVATAVVGAAGAMTPITEPERSSQA